MTFLVVLFPDLGDAISDLIKGVFGRRNGRLAGRVIAIIPMAIIYWVVINTIGSKLQFEALVNRGESMSHEEQQATIKGGMVYFVSSLISFAIPILYLAFQ